MHLTVMSHTLIILSIDCVQFAMFHQFAECNSPKTFWDLFIEWMTRVEGKNIQLDTASIIFEIFAGISN